MFSNSNMGDQYPTKRERRESEYCSLIKYKSFISISPVFFFTCCSKEANQYTLSAESFARLKIREIFDINFRELSKKNVFRDHKLS